MKRGSWKAVERRVAMRLGGVRIPVSGIDRDGADVLTPAFAVQVKCRKVLPMWLWQWMSGIVGEAKKTGRTGLLVLKRPGQRDADALVVLTMADWEAWHGRASQGDGDVAVEQRADQGVDHA